MSADSSSPCQALPTDKELVMKVIPMPADVNANGDIFGGWVMAQVDLAGAVLPVRVAKGRIVPARMLPMAVETAPKIMVM